MSRMSKTLEAGDKAPAINAVTDENKPFTLASLSGKQVVLYFYPKADTPG
jgi:thioredoxin-dependent peroxiredoxin